MTESELRIEHKLRYEEFLGNLEVWGTPTSEQHNMAVLAANEAIIRLRVDDGIVSKLRNLRLSL